MDTVKSRTGMWRVDGGGVTSGLKENAAGKILTSGLHHLSRILASPLFA